PGSDSPPGPDPMGSEGPRQLERTPEWYNALYLDPPADMPKEQRKTVSETRSLAQKSLNKLNRIGNQRGNQPRTVLTEALQDEELKPGGKGPSQEKLLSQFLAVRCIAALDDLPQLLDLLTDQEHRHVRQAALLVLRTHWLARESDHERKFFDACVDRFKSKKQAGDI